VKTPPGSWARAAGILPGDPLSPVEERIKTERTLLFLVFALGAVLRFSLLGQESLWFDEAWSISTAGAATFASLLEIVKSDSHPALYFVLLRGWVRVFGDSETATRAMSALFGTLTPLLVFLLGRALSLPSLACLLGSFLYALNTQAIWYSQEVRMYSLISFLGTLHLALTALLLGPRRLRASSWTLTAGWWITGVLCLYTHFFGVFFLAADAAGVAWTLLVLSRSRGPSHPDRVGTRRLAARRLATRFGVATVGWVVAGLPLILIVVSRLHTGRGIAWLDTARVGWETPWRILGGLLVGEQIGAGPWFLREATMGVFVLVLLYPALATYGRPFRRPSWCLPLLFMLTLVAIPAAISIVRPIIMGGRRYVSIAGAPLCLACGAGLYLLLRGRWFARALAALSLCLLLASDAAYLSTYYRGREKRMWRDAVQLVAFRDASTPMVAAPDHMALVLRYYAREGRPVIGWSEWVRDLGTYTRVWVLVEGSQRMVAPDSWLVKSSVVVRQAFDVTAVSVFLMERAPPVERGASTPPRFATATAPPPDRPPPPRGRNGG